MILISEVVQFGVGLHDIIDHFDIYQDGAEAKASQWFPERGRQEAVQLPVAMSSGCQQNVQANGQREHYVIRAGYEGQHELCTNLIEWQPRANKWGHTA